MNRNAFVNNRNSASKTKTNKSDEIDNGVWKRKNLIMDKFSDGHLVTTSIESGQ